MTADRRPGDWAAWMGSPSPASAPARPSAAVPAGAPVPVPVEEPAPAPEAAVAPSPAPASAPAPASSADIAAPVGPASVPPAAQAADVDPEGDHAAGARSARREATRQRILDAAREIFAERGVIGGSLEDICERAGFTRGAFYSNFTDKDDVLRALVERDQGRLLAHLDASFAAVNHELAAAESLESVLASIVGRIMGSIPVDRQLMLINTELEIHAIRRPDLARHLLEVNAHFRARLGEFIAAAMAQHGRELLVPVEDLTDSLIAIAERSSRRALLAGGDADEDALSRAVLPGMLLAFSRPVGERA